MSLRPNYTPKEVSTPINNTDSVSRRASTVLIVVVVAFSLLVVRLFQIQILEGQEHQARAQLQYSRTIRQVGSRGSIFTSDGFLLVGNDEVYRPFVEPMHLRLSNDELFELVAPIINDDPHASLTEERWTDLAPRIDDRRHRSGVVNLAPRINRDTRARLQELGIHGMGFDPYEVRFYPEASMAAHVVGFVGRDDDGNDQGHLGIEGALDMELRARTGSRTVAVDARGRPIRAHQSADNDHLDGRDIHLTIRRDIQSLLERELAEGIRRYGAKRGEIIVSCPHTGKILGMAVYPTYHPGYFNDFSPEVRRNQAVGDTFEPGSVFKVLTLAAGINAGVISPNTQCTRCASARSIGGFTIRNWNDVYHPNIDMTTALARSDNIAMIYVAELLGRRRFEQYLIDFGIGERLNVDLQEDFRVGMPTVWGETEIATRSFGQGIVVNSLQMVQAIGAIANGGWLMRPIIVERAVDPNTGEIFESSPERIRQVITPETSRAMSRMMRDSARYGEAQFVYRYTERIAGKTGTSQVARADGPGYYEDRTIAGFIGFAPFDNPAFVMYVKLEDTSTSPWASETAAPLWNQVAEKLFIIFNLNDE
jgi:cell division protein FtsI/penicillin-binding protein 2